MTEKEKMLGGEFYDCGDPELMEMWYYGKNLTQKYNTLDYSNRIEQHKILDELRFIRLKRTFDKKYGHGFQSRSAKIIDKAESPCPRV